MTRWIQRMWQRGLRRLGPLGLTALLLIALAAAAVTWTFQLAHSTAELHDAVTRKTAQLALLHIEPTRPAPTGAEQLATFVSTFPPLSQSASDLEQIFQAAAERSVPLTKGEYQLKADPSASLLLYTATFPVRNNYGAIKGFTTDVLKALPHASLEELRMKRDGVESTALDAVIRVTLVYRSS